MSNIPSIIGGVIALAAINRLLDTKPTGVTPTPAPKPLIPTGLGNDDIYKKPTTYATRAEPIIPFKTVEQRAEEAAIIARQAKMTREQLIGKGSSGYLSL